MLKKLSLVGRSILINFHLFDIGDTHRQESLSQLYLFHTWTHEDCYCMETFKIYIIFPWETDVLLLVWCVSIVAAVNSIGSRHEVAAGFEQVFLCMGGYHAINWATTPLTKQKSFLSIDQELQFNN